MDQTRARELQEKLALEAAAMLSLAGSGAETAPYATENHWMQTFPKQAFIILRMIFCLRETL